MLTATDARPTDPRALLALDTANGYPEVQRTTPARVPLTIPCVLMCAGAFWLVAVGWWLAGQVVR